MSKLFRCLCPVIKPGLRNGFVIYVDGEAFHDVEAAGERLSQRVHSRCLTSVFDEDAEVKAPS